MTHLDWRRETVRNTIESRYLKQLLVQLSLRSIILLFKLRHVNEESGSLPYDTRQNDPLTSYVCENR